MQNYDQSVEINHNWNWIYIHYHIYRILIIVVSGSRETNVSLNLIKDQRFDIGIIYLYVRDPSESMFQLLINGRENIDIGTIKNPREFIQYSETIDNVYQN